MELGLKHKNILVTGGSKGIGLACARLFLAEGARVAIASRDRENLERARAALGEVETFAADLRDADAAAAMVEQAEAAFGPIDILVNSAGAAQRTNADELNPAAWRAAMEAKYFTYINVIDPTVKRMAARGRGVIVNVIGSGGKVPSPIHLPGSAANAALMLVTAGLAHTYARRGVRVVGVNPGVTNTERVSGRMQAEAKRAGISEAEARAKAVQGMALGRIAEPEEIASIVVFAASDRGVYLTGANISADGATHPTVV